MIPGWILLTVIAQFFLAVVAIIDKYLVTGDGKKTTTIRPFVYAFYTSLISGAWILIYAFGLIPISLFGFSVPSFANVEVPTLVVT